MKQETLCLYSDKQSPYPYSVDSYDCFEDPILARAGLSILRYVSYEADNAALRTLGSMALILFISLRYFFRFSKRKHLIKATLMPQSKYDSFFSRSMEHSPIAQAFFAQYLPEHLRQPADLETLMRFDRANTNDQLEQRRRDIAYKIQMQGGASLLACAEHQGKEDIMMPVRFLYYNAGDLYVCLKAHKKLPVLINFLFYHGPKAPYPHHDTLQAYYDYPEWGSQELALRFHVIDATLISDEEFLQHGHCAPMALLLKHGRDGNFELGSDAYREVFQRCIAAVGDDYIFTMLTYASELSNLVAGEKIFHFIEEVLIDKKDIIMTYGQQLRQEGMQQGMQQEKLSIAKHLLSNLHLDTQAVAQATGLSQEELEKLQEKSKK